MSLTALLKKRDETALKDIYEQYGKLVFHLAFHSLEDVEAAKDITHETFLKVMEASDRLDETRNLKYYILTIAKNLITDEFRKRKRELPFNDAINPKSEPSYTTQFVPKYKKYDEIIAKFTTIISERELSIIVLHCIDNLTYREIAEFFGLNVNQVSGLAQRAIKKIKKKFDPSDFYY